MVKYAGIRKDPDGNILSVALTESLSAIVRTDDLGNQVHGNYATIYVKEQISTVPAPVISGIVTLNSIGVSPALSTQATIDYDNGIIFLIPGAAAWGSIYIAYNGIGAVVDFEKLTSRPAASTDHAIPRYDGSDGSVLQNSLVTITDGGSVSLPNGAAVGADALTASLSTASVISCAVGFNIPTGFDYNKNGNPLSTYFFNAATFSTAGNIPVFSTSTTMYDSGYIFDDTGTSAKKIWSADKIIDYSVPISAATTYGDLFTSDGMGGYTIITPGGEERILRAYSAGIFWDIDKNFYHTNNKGYYHFGYGSDGYIVVSANSNIDMTTNDFSVEFMITPNMIAGITQTLCRKYDAGAGVGWGLQVDTLTSDLILVFDDGAVDSTGVLVAGFSGIINSSDTPFKILITFNRSGSATCFCNGERMGALDISASTNSLSNIGDLFIGNNSNSVQMDLYYFRLWNCLTGTDETIQEVQYSLVDSNQTILTATGSLVEGKYYQIDTFAAGDDFLNIGASVNASGEIFNSIGTIPTTWVNGSNLRRLGCVFELKPENGNQVMCLNSMSSKMVAQVLSTASNPVYFTPETNHESKMAYYNKAADFTSFIPSNYFIDDCIIQNGITNDLTGLTISTLSSAGGDVVASCTLSSAAVLHPEIVSSAFNGNQTIWVQASAWNALGSDIYIYLKKY